MDVCHPPVFWSPLAHTSRDAWPLEYALRAFVGRWSTASFSLEEASTWPTHIGLKPTLTSFHVTRPALHLVATACSVAIIASLTSLALFLLVWKFQNPPSKPEVAVLSERAVLRIHDMASRQPYPMPPDDGGDGIFPVLPFAKNPRKQSLFIFWLFLLVFGCVVAYVLSPLWVIVVSSYVADNHSRLSWTLTLVLSAVLANISVQFLQFVFFVWPPIKSTIQWANWMVFISFKSAYTAHSAYLRGIQIAQYLSHRCLGVPLDHPLPRPIDRLAIFIAGVVSAVGGYHLISSRVARNYMLILKSIIQAPQRLGHIYFSLRQAPIFPTHHFQNWAWWAAKRILTYILGELSWRSISWPKLFVLLGPTLVVCVYGIYKYNQVIVPPRSSLQLALDPIHGEQRRQAIELAEIYRILKNLDQQFANADFRLHPGVTGTPFQ
ncbi:hypothetical protein DFH07DRAFT_845847 [Mycena maculata]|uniref:Uncharacterized protein n=1 Tax=Mycena maculata TaxID=230809 RepID=A0AAD7MV23_9AGAR|nr:hypothetical protein DFH07DRAFT_845847 [Mycena maculata]